MQLTHIYFTKIGRITGEVSISQLRDLSVPDELIREYLKHHFKEKELDFDRFKTDKKYRKTMLNRAHQTLEIQQKIENFLAQNNKMVANY